jgi:Tol biopolymer transport system component
MYFFRADKAFSTYWLLVSRCENGAWTKPIAPSFASEPKILEADPFVTPDGKRLYFVSARSTPAGREPDLDIWYVERTSDGKWSNARQLPEPVKSPGAELLPRALPDGRLIFGSNRPGGFGQGDIYIATPHSNGTWTVKNFGPPISTTAYEYEAEISQSGDTLVLVADRGDRSHLYRFTLEDGLWIELGEIPARPEVFQVGPLLSPTGDRLLFAQAIPEASGEFFRLDLNPNPDRRWPPECGRASLPRRAGPD